MHEDDRLNHALAALPRQDAGAGFTDRVLARLDAQPVDGKRLGRCMLWAGAVAVLALAVLGAGAWRRQQERQAARAELEAIRVEHRQLLDDLELLSEVVDQEQPLLYLAGDENADLVLDLAPAARVQNETRARPAQWSPSDRETAARGDDR